MRPEHPCRLHACPEGVVCDDLPDGDGDCVGVVGAAVERDDFAYRDRAKVSLDDLTHLVRVYRRVCRQEELLQEVDEREGTNGDRLDAILEGSWGVVAKRHLANDEIVINPTQ